MSPARIAATALALLVAGSAAGPRQARAQELTLGAEVDLAVPVGRWADHAGIGLGGSVRVGYPLGAGVDLIGRAGVILHLAHDVAGADFSTREIPLLAGLQYTPVAPLHVEAAVGPVYFGVRAPGYEDAELKFGMAIGAGATLFGFGLDLQVFWPDLEDVDDLVGLLFSVGYNFL